MSLNAHSDKGVVAAPHSLAAETGRAILEEGGTAIEAAIAMGATIAVTYPHMSGLGGDGFFLIREPNGRVGYIEACGPAGSGASLAAYRKLGLDAVPARGPLGAATVAGVTAGWKLAREAGRGRLPLDVLFSDAIRHAREGFKVSTGQGQNQPKLQAELFKAPGFAGQYLKEGKLYGEGEVLRQEKIAATFEQLAHAGLDDFYRGDIGREIAADLEAIRSPVTREDLQRYEARLREPLKLSLKSATVWNSPPPTQGLASLLILGIAEKLDLGRPESVEFVHGLVEATKRAFLVRDRAITDPAFMESDPKEYLTPEWLMAEAAKVKKDRALPWPAPPGEGDTVWMGAIDREGRAVSYIQSLYWEWGSGCVLPKTGIIWQNRGCGFSLDERSSNPLQPGRLPFHTLNPPIAVMKDGRVISYGSMGGDGQPQTQAAVFVRYLMGKTVEEAVDLPRWRLGKSWGANDTTLKIEPRFDGAVIEKLGKLGHEVEVLDKPYSSETGHAGLIVRHPDGKIEGVHDRRADGGALGL
ncbi:gamma-glutamyltranspeptidase [Terrihabitans soli]|uniref:Gamma-glutamyltranspeptidase n=1 Tax=Terrihabitans soli TaxID=708113 RepID=A0A6S6QPS3_9HYPH|nr:gamma-glutamyltransferase family protein [Terrihabitans soli]BCJ89775.1 gamma-glutamyltranspeptidase [Terrihabitans soli]